MRWLRGLEATELTASDTGGRCEGTGRPVGAQCELLVTLAGFAYESGCGFSKVDFAKSQTEDFTSAREMLATTEYLRIMVSLDGVIKVMEVEEALAHHFARAGELLFPHIDIVEHLGSLLAEKRRLSARSVAAVLREYRKAGLKGH